ncbi:MAG TPA: hypothetical protein VGC94_05290 [Amnibacterium sp.]
MGEHNAFAWVRAGGAVAVSVAAVVALSSCSLLQVAPSPVVTSSPHQTEVIDPSIPLPTAPPTDSPAPDPSATPLPSPTPTASPTLVPGTTKRAVSPFVTLADWDASSRELDVSALVPNLVESGGTCTAIVTKGGITRTASAPAAAVSTYVGCNPMAIPGSALSAGTWTVHVTYSSKSAAGTSAAKSVEVTK